VQVIIYLAMIPVQIFSGARQKGVQQSGYYLVWITVEAVS